MDPREFKHLQELVHAQGEELAVVQVLMKKVDAALFGEYGQPGVLQRYEERISKLETKWIVVITVLGVLQFLSGSGIISLKALIGK